MQRILRLFIVLPAVLAFWQQPATAPQKPAVSIPVISATSGDSIPIDVPLTEPFSAAFTASAFYVEEDVARGRMPNQSPPNPVEAFICDGSAQVGDKKIRLMCGTSPYNKGGIYRVNSSGLNMSRVMTYERESDSTLRFPIIKLKATKAPEKLGFPGRGQPVVVPTVHETLEDEADKTQEIRDEVVKHYLEGEGKPGEEQHYLLDVVAREQAILNLTRERFATAINGKQLPIFFNDFDERLKQLRSDIGEPRRNESSSLRSGDRPRLILAQQIPHTSDSAEAQAAKSPIRKNYAELVEILADLIDLPARILDDGTSEFEWSLAAAPPGAEVYYSRLHKEEIHWAGGTPIEKAKLPYARWTWRIIWGNCSKRDSPDPYYQGKIVMKETEAGCKTR